MFGFLKKVWYKIVKNISENLSKFSGKKNFVLNLYEMYIVFYKFSIIIWVFIGFSICFVRSFVILNEKCKLFNIFIDIEIYEIRF